MNDLLTIQEVAERLHIDKQRIYYHIRETNKIPEPGHTFGPDNSYRVNSTEYDFIKKFFGK